MTSDFSRRPDSGSQRYGMQGSRKSSEPTSKLTRDLKYITRKRIYLNSDTLNVFTYRAEDNRSVVSAVRVYGRKENKQSIEPSTRASGGARLVVTLFRCKSSQ